MIALLALALCVGLPGLAGGVTLSRFSDDPARAGVLLTRTVASGLVVWLFAMGLLERTAGISATSTWVVTAVLSAASLVVLALPASRTLLRQAWRDVALGAAATGLGLISWLPVALLNYRTTWGVIAPTPWYYWGLAQQIATVGHVPARSVEWGTTVPFLDDYHLFSVASAALLDQTPGNGVAALHATMALALGASACGTVVFAIALGAWRWAALVAVPLFIAVDVFAIGLSSYRPEPLGVALVFFVAVLALDWLRRRDVAALALGAAVVAALSEVHTIALMVAGCLVIGCVLGAIPSAVGRAGGRFVVIRGISWRFVRDVGLLAAVWALSCWALAAIMGTHAASQNAGGLSQTSGLNDPTWEFLRAIRGLPNSIPPSNWDLASSALDTAYFHFSPWSFGGTVAATVLVLAAAAMLPALRRRRRGGEESPPERRALAVALGFVILLGSVAAVFAFSWTSYVPRRTGSYRLLQLAPVVVPAFAAVALSTAGTWLPSRRARTTLLVCVLAATTVLGGAASSRTADWYTRYRPTQADARQLQALRLGHDAVVLANAYTEGTIRRLLGADGLLEGRAPYTYPDLLRRANGLLRGAAEFYAHPAHNLGFLSSNNVSYVVVLRRHRQALGTPNMFVKRAPTRAFAAVPSLRLVVRGDDFTVYRFIGSR